MNEIYWLTRLDDINNILKIFMLISIFGTIAFIVSSIIRKSNESYGEDDRDYCNASAIRRYTLPFVIILSITSIALAFIPTTKDAYMIYGLGSTIEYLKDNDKAKQLPDKAIEALDLWLENNNQELRDKCNGVEGSKIESEDQ